MRKHLSIAAKLVAIALVAGCGSSEQVIQQPSSTTTTNAPATTTTTTTSTSTTTTLFPQGKLASLNWNMSQKVVTGTVEVGSTYTYPIELKQGGGESTAVPYTGLPSRVVTTCCTVITGYAFAGETAWWNVPKTATSLTDEFILSAGTVVSSDGRTITGSWLNNRRNQQGTFIMTATAPFGVFTP